MKDDFFKADGGGDPSSFNNGLWFFGHPFVWLVIFLWLIIFIAAVKLATRLWRQKKFIWFFAFVIIASSALAYYVYLSKNAHGLYAEGINEGCKDNCSDFIFPICLLDYFGLGKKETSLVPVLLYKFESRPLRMNRCGGPKDC